jgi:L-lactate transport
MWQHNYVPLGNLALSASVAAAPVFVLMLLLGILRKPAWLAAIAGLSAAILTAAFAYHMPATQMLGAITYGAAFGLFPIGWIVLSAIFLYNLTVETGQFEVLKASVGALTSDRRLQALLVAFAFGAFLEGAAGFGTPVAVAAAMLTGLGFEPFYAAAICLLANTAPVAFGSIGIPLTTLAAITSLPLDRLSAGVGRICAPVSLFIPAYLILVMGGWKGLMGVLPAAAVCGIAFAGTQFVVSNFVGPELTDILASLAAMVGLVILFRVWKPSDAPAGTGEARRFERGQVLLAWAPYLLLVGFVLMWGYKPFQTLLQSKTLMIPWPGLHNQIQRMPPVAKVASPYGAQFTWNWLAASGTACFFACISSALALRVSVSRFFRVLGSTLKQLARAEFTLACVLALAFLMNYSGATATLGLAFAATGAAFPFFSALLGWLGVFLTGSDTSANALFGNLQVVSAERLGMNPVLMAAANSSGGVMGKMISLTSVAVASAATGMKRQDESRLFQFTLGHSIFLASVIGLIVLGYAYVFPHWAP